MKISSRRTTVAASGYTAPVPTIPGLRLLNHIGSGTYGDIWRAKTQSGITVAVKFFKQPLQLRPKKVFDCNQEIAISKLLSSKANNDVPIVKTLNSYTHSYTRSKSETNITNINDETPKYMVMEYCHGGSLFDLTLFGTKKLLSESEASMVAYPVASALAFCHSNNVLHLDVKPHLFREKPQIFGTRRHLNSACLADFGVSEYTHEANVKYAMTGPVGSPRYMAPEIKTASVYTPAADAWSLGVLLLEILTGIVPPEAVISEALLESNNLQWVDRYIASLSLPKQNYAGRKVWQQKLSSDAKDVIRRLLMPEHSRRLSISDLLSHKWLIEAKQCCCKSTSTTTEITTPVAAKFRGCFGR